MQDKGKTQVPTERGFFPNRRGFWWTRRWFLVVVVVTILVLGDKFSGE